MNYYLKTRSLNDESRKILYTPLEVKHIPDSRGLGVTIMEKMKKYGCNVAQIDSETDQAITYKELLLQSIRLAQNLAGRGIKSEDIIALCTYNTMESALPLFAALFLGIRIYAMDPTLSQSDIQYMLKTIPPRYIFSCPESVEIINKSLQNNGMSSKLVVFGDTEIYIPFSELLRSTGMEEDFQAKPARSLFDTPVIFFSSGTTGLAKGVCTTHFGLHVQQSIYLKTIDPSVILYFTSYYWASAITLTITAILSGSTRVICKSFNEDTALDIIQKYKVTYAFMSPFLLNRLANRFTSSQFDTSKLYSLSVSGGVMNEEQMKKVRRLLPHTIVVSGYGMTEANGFVTIFDCGKDKSLIATKLISCGRPMQGTYYKIVDPETGKICGPLEPGELLLKGKCLMAGYFNEPEKTKSVYDEQGFLHTGDIAYYDEDECFYITSRIKDMMKYQSWHVIPVELENILTSHPDVEEAAVVGKPHEIDGEHPTGFIVLKPESKATAEGILHFYNDKILHFERKKLRGGLHLIESIPRTPSGKIRRYVLQHTYFKT